MKLSVQKMSLVYCVAAAAVGFGILPGCATRSDPLVVTTASGLEDPAAEGASFDSIIVPTEEVFGSRDSSTAETETEEQVFPEVNPDLIYRIGPGDTVSLISFDDERLSMSVMVRYDGHVSFQVIPDLKLLGLTRSEAEELLREAYSEFYVEPQLTMAITGTGGKFFNVLGEVERPGELPYRRPISLIEAITAAGGLRVNRQGGDSFTGAQGQLVKAAIIRTVGADRQIKEYDLRDWEKPGHQAAFTLVLPGDTVVVPEAANLVYLLGEVRSPSVYSITKGLTLIRLLASAGGYSESTARLRNVAITREISDTETKIMTFDVRENLKAGTDMLLQPGDIIYVPRKRLINAADFMARVTAPASIGMSFTSQMMGLYTQAWDVWYTDDRYRLLYGSNSNDPPVVIFPPRSTATNTGPSAIQLIPPVNR